MVFIIIFGFLCVGIKAGWYDYAALVHVGFSNFVHIKLLGAWYLNAQCKPPDTTAYPVTFKVLGE